MLFASAARTGAASLALLAATAGVASASTVTASGLYFETNKTKCPASGTGGAAGKFVQGYVAGDLTGTVTGCLYAPASAANAVTATYTGTLTIATKSESLGLVIGALAIDGAGGPGNAALSGSYTVVGARASIGSVGTFSGFATPRTLYFTVQGPLVP
jgi:hypothetical protein